MSYAVFHQQNVFGLSANWTFNNGVITTPAATNQPPVNVWQRAMQLTPGQVDVRQYQYSGLGNVATSQIRVQDLNWNNRTDQQDLVSVTVSGNQGTFNFYYDNTHLDGDPASYQWEQGTPVVQQQNPWQNPYPQYPNNPYFPNYPYNNWPNQCPPQYQRVPPIPPYLRGYPFNPNFRIPPPPQVYPGQRLYLQWSAPRPYDQFATPFERQFLHLRWYVADNDEALPPVDELYPDPQPNLYSDEIAEETLA